MSSTAGGSPEEFTAFVRDDTARMARWIKVGDIRMDEPDSFKPLTETL